MSSATDLFGEAETETEAAVLPTETETATAERPPVKITINRKQFLSAWQVAASFAPSRTPKPVLQNVKLFAFFQDEDGEELNAGTEAQSFCELVGTDLEVGARVAVDGVVIDRPGKVLLPVADFGAILRESDDETLTIEVVVHKKSGLPTGIVVKGESSEFELHYVEPNEFPGAFEFTAESYVQVNAMKFAEAVKRTEFCVGDDSRYAMGAILLFVEDTSLRAISTDGRRMAATTISADLVGDGAEIVRSILIPAGSIRTIMRSLDAADDFVQIAAGANDVLIRTARGVFYSRLMEGRFPKWDTIMPKPDAAGEFEFESPAGLLLSKVRQVAIACSIESRRIDLRIGGGRLKMTAAAADRGRSQVEMPVSYSGEETIRRLDHRYMADFLKVAGSGTDRDVRVQFKGTNDPIVLSTDGDQYQYLICQIQES